MTGPHIEAQGLCYAYPDGTSALDSVSFSILRGECVGLVGANGAGKSTLLILLAGLAFARSGTISLGGEVVERRSLASIRRKLGFVFQDHHLLPQCTALENVLVPTLARARAEALTGREIGPELLARVGLAAHAHKRPHQLSGGERQRAAVARALVTTPRLVLADEPTGNLDGANAEQVFQLMLELNRERGTSLVVVTHDPRLAERMDRVLRLVDGQLVPA